MERVKSLSQQFSSVSQPFYTRVIMMVSIIVIATTIVASLLLYVFADQRLEEGYAQNLIELSQYKSELVRKSVIIYIGFGLLAMVIVAAYGVYFSHKIAGPLVRVRRFTSEMAQGEYDLKVIFRQGDFIHVLAHAADNCAEWYREKHFEVMKVLEDIEDAALELEDAVTEMERSGQEGEAEKRVELLKGKLDLSAKNLERVISEIRI